MKFFFLFLCFEIAVPCLAQKNNCDSIPWTKERKLSWDDFKAIPDTGTKDTAQSFVRLYKKWTMRADTFAIQVSVFFRPCLSWSKTKISDTLLIHEQGHFDISEYFRRLMIKRFSEQNFTRKNLRSEIDAISRDIEKQQKDFIALYEAETNYSRNRPKQIEWTEKIRGLLSSVDSFDFTNLTKTVSDNLD